VDNKLKISLGFWVAGMLGGSVFCCMFTFCGNGSESTDVSSCLSLNSCGVVDCECTDGIGGGGGGGCLIERL